MILIILSNAGGPCDLGTRNEWSDGLFDKRLDL